jgi:hypothetical protein
MEIPQEAVFARQLLAELACLLPNAMEREFPGHLGCILATRLAIEVCEHFGVKARPLACQVIAYNAQYKAHMDRGDEFDVERWYREDGAHSVGIGFDQGDQPGSWNGHLIVVAEDTFADYTLMNVERPMLGLIIGMPLVGPYRGTRTWMAENGHGTVVEYKEIDNTRYRAAPDWTDPKRRKAICGPLIREMERRFS